MRECVGRGGREEATRRAIERIAELERPGVAVDSPSLARVGAELIVAKDKAGHAAGYVSAIEGHLRNFALPHYGLDTRITDVAADEHRRFKHVLGDGDIDLRTCNRVLTTLRQLFLFGEEKGYCGAHPMPKNFREDPQTMVERWRILSPEQIGTLLAHAGADHQPLLAFVANTGLRIGTALQTEAAWIDWRGRLVNYPASSMKGRRAHTVELNEAAFAFLRQASTAAAASRRSVSDGDDKPVRPFPFSYWYLAKRWPAIRDAAGFPGLRIHDLRHRFVSNQLAAGTPIHTWCATWPRIARSR